MARAHSTAWTGRRYRYSRHVLAFQLSSAAAKQQDEAGVISIVSLNSRQIAVATAAPIDDSLFIVLVVMTVRRKKITMV